MKRRLVALVLIGVLLAGVFSSAAAGKVSAAPARSHVAAIHTDAHAAAFDKTRFVAHLAVAAFLVHYIYKKYKDGKLGRTHIFTDIKAAVAALLAYHEMKKAYDIAKTSNSKTLQALVAPISALTGTLDTMSSKLKHGDTSQISTANSQESSLQSTSSKNGFGYKDQQPSGFSGF
ncbi:MAG TPA: hypothetical protein VF221_18780 [Chloroflexota bacterium]